MGKDNIRVFLRVRPDKDRRQYEQRFSVEHTFDASTIQFRVDRKQEGEVVNHSVEDYRFRFDRVFEPRTTQEELFNMVARDCTMSALDGYNSTIFAYGQTGSGKTYSITGGTDSYNDRGIIPRCISLIYDEMAKRTDYEWQVRISYLQIYNDKGQDLLNHGNDARTLEELPTVTVHEGEEEVLLKGLESSPSNSVHDALNLLFLGDTNRLTCETPMNKTSTRSHCIFTIALEARAKNGGATVRHSKLNLVDLAGSERVSKTGVVGNLLTEAKYINLSLHYLEHVIVALSEQAQGRRDHVPFRNSMMTMVLKDSLGGNCRTAMLATCYPTEQFFMETISTCKFAQRVSQIKQHAHVNEETDPVILVRKLKAENATLKEQLAFYTKGEQVGGDRELSSDEMERCREVVQRYLENPEKAATISGVAGDLNRIYACFAVMKGMLLSKDWRAALGGAPPSAAGGAQQLASGNSSSSGQPADGALAEKVRHQIESLQASLQQKENELTMLFNIVEQHNVPKFNAQTQTAPEDLLSSGRAMPHGGSTSSSVVSLPPIGTGGGGNSSSVVNNSGSFSRGNPLLPLPQQTAMPATQRQLPSNLQPHEAAAVQEYAQKQNALRDRYDLSVLSDAEMLKDRATAFEAFRRSYRKYEMIEKNKSELQQKCEECKKTADIINEHVDAIKQIKAEVQRLRAERALQGQDEPYPKEGVLMEELQRRKAEYTALGKSLAESKVYINGMHGMILKSQEQASKDFEEWFALRQKQVLLAQHSEPSQPLTSSSAALPAPPILQPAKDTGMLSSSTIGQLLSVQRQQVSSAPVGATSATGGPSQFLRSTVNVTPPAQPLAPADPFGLRRMDSSTAFAAEQHRQVMLEHQRHNATVENTLTTRNPYLPSQPSTGMAAADEQIAQLHKAREEMRKRLLNLK